MNIQKNSNISNKCIKYPRIAVISDSLHEIGGGVNQVVKNQIEVLSEGFGLMVTLITRGGDYSPASTNVQMRVLPATNRPSCLRDVLRKWLDGHDLVFIHNLLTTPYNPDLTEAFRLIIADECSSRRYIAWTHDVFQHGGKIAGVDYVAISRHRRDQLNQELGIPAKNIYIAPNGVNLLSVLNLSSTARRLFNRLNLFACDHIAWYPVRLARNKNFELAIAIVAALNAKGIRTKILIPGVSSDNAQWQLDYYNELRCYARRLSVEDKIVFLTDFRTDSGSRLEITDRIRDDLYRVATFLLFTSRDEGFGVPLLEAAAYRLPVVACDIPSVNEITENCRICKIDTDIDPVLAADKILGYLNSCPTTTLHLRTRCWYELRGSMARFLKNIGYRFPQLQTVPAIGAQSAKLYPLPLQGQIIDAFMNGCDAFEIYFDGFSPEETDELCKKALTRTAIDPGIELLVHASLQNSNLLFAWLKNVEAALHFADDVGARIVTAVLPSLTPSMTAALQNVIKLAAKTGTMIAFENGPYACWKSGFRFNSYVKKLRSTYPAYASHIGIGFNPRRASAYGDAVKFASFLDSVAIVHISDREVNGNENIRIGKGTLSLPNIIEALMQAKKAPSMFILEYFYTDIACDRTLLRHWLNSCTGRTRPVRQDDPATVMEVV